MMSYKRNPGDWNNSRTTHGRTATTATTTNQPYSTNNNATSLLSYSIDNSNPLTTNSTNNNDTFTTTTRNHFNYPQQGQPPLSHSRTTATQHHHHYHNTNQLALLRKQQELEQSKQWLTLNIEQKLKRMPDPPICFCGREASRSKTALGVMYDCNALQCEDAKQICGFHVHARAWNQFRQQLLKGQDLDQHDPELSVCPYFNFTFCVLFFYINDYPKRFPPTPKCFCHLQVIIHEVEEQYQKKEQKLGYWKRFEFKCPHHHIDGAKPKCTWTCKANEVAFRRPKRVIHSKDIDDYVARLRAQKQQQLDHDDKEESVSDAGLIPTPTTSSSMPLETTSLSASTSTSSSSIVSSVHHLAPANEKE